MHRPLLLAALGSALVATSVATAAPDSALPDLSPRQKTAFGAHSLRSLVPAGDIKQVDPGVIRPDLTFGQTSWSPATYLPPAKLKFTCQIRNDGIAAAGPFHVYCFGGGSLWPQVAFVAYGLKRNESTMCSFDFQYSAGPSPANVWIDYNHEVVESNETNNHRSTAPELEASAYDFYAQDLWLEYDPNSLLGQLLGNQHVSQPVGGFPMLMKGVVGYRNKVDQKPLSYSVNVYFDGVIQKTYKVTIPANGTVEISHPVTLPGGDHRLKIGASGISVDKSWAGNELEKTFHWRTTAKAPFRHVYFAIGNYAALGDASNLSQSLNEGRRFGNRMVALGHPHTYHAENTAVNWDDWTGGPSARVNNAEIAYFVGHGNSDGPFYSSKGFNGNTYMMVPSQYRLGRDNGGQNTLRWAVWSACETLYDGVTDQSRINWDGPVAPLNRWFQAFNGLHAIVGMRSLGWQGYWHGGSDDTRQRASDFVNLISGGTDFSWAWFLANRYCVWDELDRGFESAVLTAEAEGTDYSTELFTAPYPDYTTPPTGFYYATWRIGNPSW